MCILTSEPLVCMPITGSFLCFSIFFLFMIQKCDKNPTKMISTIESCAKHLSTH